MTGQSGHERVLLPLPTRRTDGRGAEGQVRHGDAGRLVDARARVVEEEQERMIARPLRRASMGCLQDGIDLRLVEIGHGRLRGLFLNGTARISVHQAQVFRAVHAARSV